MREYAERDILKQGNHYMRHVAAMTTEGLYSKSDIAAELAHRDIEIERLKLVIQEAEANTKDAQRYRWLREHGRYSGKVLVDHADMGRVLRIEKQLDEIIDAEMQRPNT